MIAAGINTQDINYNLLPDAQRSQALQDISDYEGGTACSSDTCELRAIPAPDASDPLKADKEKAIKAYERLTKLVAGDCDGAYGVACTGAPPSPPPAAKECDKAQEPVLKAAGCTPTCDTTKGEWKCGASGDSADKPEDATPGSTGFRWYDGIFLGYGVGLGDGFSADEGLGIYPYVTESSPVTHRFFGGYAYPIELSPNWALRAGVELFSGWNPSTAPDDLNGSVPGARGPRTSSLKHFGIGPVFGPEYRSAGGVVAGLQVGLGYKSLWGENFDAGAGGFQESVDFDTFYLAPQVYAGWEGIQLVLRPEISFGDRYKEKPGMTTADYGRYRYGVGDIDSNTGSTAFFAYLRFEPGRWFGRQ